MEIPEEEVMIDIDASVSCKAESNTVEISVERDTEMLYTYVSGNEVKLGSGIAPPYPIPHLLVNNIVSFDPQNIFHLLCSKLQDPILCTCLSVKIASVAERVPGPLYISLHVTLTPKRFLGANCITTEEDDDETCAICLGEEEDGQELFVLPNCPHAFHHDCINEWLIKSNTCPLCRTVVLDEDDDHPYYSD